MQRALALTLLLLAGGTGAADDAPAKKDLRPKLEVEIEKTGDTARITVYLNNEGGTEFSFETGSHGGGGSLDDRAKIVVGTGPKVLPEVTFLHGDRHVTLRPPVFSGPTRRTMTAAKLSVPADKRVVYASWVVPADLVAGKMSVARLKPSADKELLTYDSKVIDKTPPKK